jgi:hypothetical protein
MVFLIGVLRYCDANAVPLSIRRNAGMHQQIQLILVHDMPVRTEFERKAAPILSGEPFLNWHDPCES